MNQSLSLILELKFIGRFFVTISFTLTILFIVLMVVKRIKFHLLLNTIFVSSSFYVFLTSLISLIYLFFSFRFFFLYYNNFNSVVLSNDLLGIANANSNIIFELYNSYIDFYFLRTFLVFSLNKFNISFILLFATLYPIICSLILIDKNVFSCKYFFHMQLVFSLSFLLLLTENILVFYFIYESIVFLTYSILNLSSNSRGNIEASLHFLGWAILGSILVGFGVMWYIICLNSSSFLVISNSKLTHFESNTLYLLLFLGFGTKMSLWPFWYWLPKAHVEVSTGASIFLSCILIKIALFCMLKIQYNLPGELLSYICIFMGALGVIDVVFKILCVRDLKSLIAHSSVLHTNLLIMLIHVETHHLGLNNILLYIWGHSLGTAGLFLCVYVIELRYGTRNVIHISGIWHCMPILGYLIIWNLLSFLEFPITVFFWGELWLWVCLVSHFPIFSTQLLFCCCCIFLCIFFKFWWGVLFGASSIASKNFNYSLYRWIVVYLIWILFLQILVGIQPSLLTSIIGLR